MKDINLEELGKKIGEEVYKFVDPEEMRGLQREIRATVEKTVDGLRSTGQAASEFIKQDVESYLEKYGSHKEKGCQSKEEQLKEKILKEELRKKELWNKKAERKSAKRFLSSIGPWSGVPGAVLQVVGSLGVTAFTILAVVFAAAAMAMSEDAVLVGWVITGILGAMAAGSGIVAFCGSRMRRLVRSFRQYRKVIGNREVCQVEELAAASGGRAEDVRKRLKQMLRKGWFPEGCMDAGESCLILTKEAYGHYLDAMEQQALRSKEEQERVRLEEIRCQDPAYRQLRVMLAEGEEYIRRIREINDEIPEEEISAKMDRLEEICGQIFSHVEKKPEKLPGIRKLMSYYLPTVWKLMEAYLSFEKEKVQGKNVRQVQLEIEEALDDINMAFEKIYHRLFEEEVLDISTDISALSAMLSQEGLLEDELSPR